MTMFLIASAMGGLGLWLLLVGLVPPKLTLTQQMARVPAAESGSPGVSQGRDDVGARLSGRAADLLSRAGLPGAKVRAQLVLLERPVEPLLAQKAMTAAFGLMLPLASFTALTLVGISVPLLVPAVAGLALSVALFMVPDLAVHTHAEQYRAEARVAVRTFLDQAVITLAGGAGIEGALIAAARGHGPTFRRIRQALDAARLRNEPAWPHLDALGRELGLRELSELAAVCALADSEGSKVKASIAAKARSMREREFAVTIEAAEAATERLAVPGGLMGMSFVCFLVYAALAAAAKSM